jgi:8-oxo-dGTP pyrophosphatase MutT (NUDIX family)
MEILNFNTNPFGGVLVDPLKLPFDAQGFRSRLAYSMDEWIAEGYKVAWLEVPLDKSALVPVAAEAGFSYHHADGEYVMMTNQLEQDSYIPPYATHYVGAGAVVVSEKRELLVVSERYKFRGSRGPAYKLPGGALMQGEHLAEAIVREVLEETGIQTKFEALACFRHWHGYRYGKSDIYFVCRLSPLTYDITRQEEEIAECLWMPVDDFLEGPQIGNFNKSIVKAALEHPGISPGDVEGYGDPERFEFFLPNGQR